MAAPSLLEECQLWIEKGQESWKSYFSKWEAFAKYEEIIPEGELIFEVSRRHKPESLIHQKTKQLFSQKKQKILNFKKQQIKKKKVIKKKKNYQKPVPVTNDKEVSNKRPSSENILEVAQNIQLEKTLKAVFSEFFKVNSNHFEVFAVLYQTVAAEEVTMKNSDCLSSEQNDVLHYSDSDLNVKSLSVKKPLVFSSPICKISLGRQSVCPPRDAYIESLNSGIKAIEYKPKKDDSAVKKWVNLSVKRQTDFWNYSSGQKCLGGVTDCHTPLPGPKPNLQVKSCPPLYPRSYICKKAGLKSVGLGFNRKYETDLFENKKKDYYENSQIFKMNITQEEKGLELLYLHKRTNSVGLRMENSNFITPQRKSSEQKCFNKIVSQRCPSKKLFFNNEEDDSESDEKTEYSSSLTCRRNKRQKVDESEAEVVESDFNDCVSIFDRIKKA